MINNLIYLINRMKTLPKPKVTWIFLLPLYPGSEVWDCIWNQTHLVVWNFCLERLHCVTISLDKARSKRWCQSWRTTDMEALLRHIYSKNLVFTGWYGWKTGSAIYTFLNIYASWSVIYSIRKFCDINFSKYLLYQSKHKI